MKYTVTFTVDMTRKMTGADGFLLCTTQRAGLKRKPNKVHVRNITVKARQ
jgi:hypothetical protein